MPVLDLPTKTGEEWVAQANGQDLLQKFNAYAFEKTLCLKKGIHILPDILSIPDDLTTGIARHIHIKGRGPDSIIQGGGVGSPHVDESLIKSLQSSWVSHDEFPRLTLENLTLKGSGVEHYLIDGSCMLVNGIGRVTLAGALRAAADGIGIYTYGSGAPATPSGFDNLYVYPTSTWDKGADIKAENLAIRNFVAVPSEASLTTGLKNTVNCHIGNAGAWVGTNKSMSRVLWLKLAEVGQIFVNHATAPTTFPYALKTIGPVKLGTVILHAMPTGVIYQPFEDATTTLLVDAGLFDFKVAYSSAGATKTDPNTSYVLWDAAYDFNVDLTPWKYAQVRMDDGRGNEAGAGKGVAIYNTTNTANLCDVTWTGSGTEIARVGAWVDLVALGASGTGVKACRLYVKGASATENITFVGKISLVLAGKRYA